jgi:hypothetical protein
MKAYVGSVDRAGSRWLLAEDVLPTGLLRHEVRRRWSESTTAVWALLDDEAAAAIRADLIGGHPRDACNLLLNRAVELLSPLRASRPRRHDHDPSRCVAVIEPGANPQAGASDSRLYVARREKVRVFQWVQVPPG